MHYPLLKYRIFSSVNIWLYKAASQRHVIVEKYLARFLWKRIQFCWIFDQYNSAWRVSHCITSWNDNGQFCCVWVSFIHLLGIMFYQLQWKEFTKSVLNWFVILFRLFFYSDYTSTVENNPLWFPLSLLSYYKRNFIKRLRSTDTTKQSH